MGFKNDRTFLAVEDVKVIFLQFLRCHKTDFNWAWFYGVKIDQSNPHIITYILGLDDDGALKVLYLFKIAYHQGILYKYAENSSIGKEKTVKGSHYFGMIM